METISAALPLLVSQFKASPAEWTTAALILLTLLFTVYLTWAGRKKVSIYYGQRPYRENFMQLVATNTGSTRNIRVLRYGYKTWDGLEWSDTHHAPEENFEVGSRLGWSLEVLGGGKFLLVEDRPIIYYTFVEDTTGKKYKEYAYWRPISWVIRLWYFCSPKRTPWQR